MSRSVTSFAYGSVSVAMECNPHHPRNVSESKAFSTGYASNGDAYAYDPGTPLVRTEQLEFPAITWHNVQAVLDFIERTILGGRRQFTWHDMGTTRTARYTGCSYQQVSKQLWRLSLTLEVLT